MQEAIEEASHIIPATEEEAPKKKKKKKDKKRKSEALENGDANGTVENGQNGDAMEVDGEEETPKKKKKKKKSKSHTEDE